MESGHTFPLSREGVQFPRSRTYGAGPVAWIIGRGYSVTHAARHRAIRSFCPKGTAAGSTPARRPTSASLRGVVVTLPALPIRVTGLLTAACRVLACRRIRGFIRRSGNPSRRPRLEILARHTGIGV